MATLLKLKRGPKPAPAPAPAPPTAAPAPMAITGSAGNDKLTGGNGNDTLMGGAGSDTLNGGLGQDLFVFNTVGDSPKSNTQPSDVIQNFTFGDTAANAEADLIQLGGATVNSAKYVTVSGAVFANASSFQNFLNANMQANEALLVHVLNGPAAGREFVFADTDGLAGYSTANGYAIQLSGAVNAQGITVSNFKNAAPAPAPAPVPAPAPSTVTVTGTAGNDTLTGDANLASLIQGLAGNDTLTGGAANDTLEGGAGTDRMNGGTGQDKFVFNSSSESPMSNKQPSDVVQGFTFGNVTSNIEADLFQLVGATVTAARYVGVTGTQFSTLNAYLQANMRANEALLVHVLSGAAQNREFLFADTDGAAGFNSANGFAIELVGSVNATGIDVSNFIA